MTCLCFLRNSTASEVKIYFWNSSTLHPRGTWASFWIFLRKGYSGNIHGLFSLSSLFLCLGCRLSVEGSANHRGGWWFSASWVGRFWVPLMRHFVYKQLMFAIHSSIHTSSWQRVLKIYVLRCLYTKMNRTWWVKNLDERERHVIK